MTDNELKDYFATKELPTGFVKFSAFETAPDLRKMVNMALEHIASGGQGAAVSREALHRLVTYLETPKPEPGT